MDIPSKPQTRGDIKIIVVGNSGTGKTCFCGVWTKNEFKDTYKATIMADFSNKIFKYKGSTYKVHLWDIGGQDKNVHATKVLTKDAFGCLVMCDCKDQKSLEETLKWKKAIESNTKFKDGKELPMYLVQNKIDLLTEDELKDETKIKEFAITNNFASYTRTSAKMKIGIEETMESLLGLIIERVNKYEKESNTKIFSEERNSIMLEKPKEKETIEKLDNNKGCC